MPKISSEQALLSDSARGLFDTGSQLQRVRKADPAWPDVDRAVWREACEAGWLKLLLREQDDGWGASVSDLMAILDGAADLLVPEPFAPGLVVTALLQGCATPDARALLDEMLQGRSITLLASTETFPLTGAPTYAIAEAQWADHVVCPNWESGVLQLVVAAREDLDEVWRVRRTIDGGGLRFFSLDNIPSRESAAELGVERTFSKAQNPLRLSASASLVGIAQHAFDITLDYLKTRRQFGTPIGAFQALQHRAASMHVSCMAARALVNEAFSRSIRRKSSRPARWPRPRRRPWPSHWSRSACRCMARLASPMSTSLLYTSDAL